MRRSAVGYRWRGGALLRASTAPPELDVPRDPALLDDGAVPRQRAWIADVWARKDVRDALAAASPALCRQVEAVVSGACTEPRRVRRTVLSLVSYLLRWQRRATPFGLFAGVAPVGTAHEPSVAWGGKHQVSARPDGEWLTDVISRLDQCRELRERLHVVANDTGQARGDRFVAPGPPADGRARHMAPLEVSVRRTRPVAAALEEARTPVRYGELCARLARLFPTAGEDRIRAVLDGLIDQNLLVSSLWPPMTCLDTLGYVCAELDAVRAQGIDAIAPLVAELRTIRDDLAERSPGALAESSRDSVVERMRKLSDVAPFPLVLDTALDCDLRIPEQVVREVEEAVEVLCRLTPYPAGYPQWRDYHARFLERYGPEAAVPVLELVSDSGLGLPSGYLGSAYRADPRCLEERDSILLSLVQQALLDGRDEIVLTRRLVESLEGGEAANAAYVPRVEVAVEVHAPSVAALAGGLFRLVVSGAPRPGSSMAGRFAHLLPAGEQARLAATYQASGADSVTAQLSFAPRRRRNENVARTQKMLENVIPLAESRVSGKGVIPLTDLAVTADSRRFALIRLSTGQRVEPQVLHALEAGIHTPPLARFLSEVTTAHCAAYQSFDFGAAAHLPYLPRVRYRNTVLSPARWLLDRDDLPGRRVSLQQWEAGLEAWRSRLRVPEHVAMVHRGQRLPLDLSHPLHRRLLRARLESTGRLELREDFSGEGPGWLGRPHELLLVLTRADATVPVQQTGGAVRPGTEHPRDRSPVLRVQIDTHPQRHDELLTRHLPLLLDGLPAARWWFDRRRDGHRSAVGQYLVLYIRLAEGCSYGQAAERVRDWADELRRVRLASHSVLAADVSGGSAGHSLASEAVETVSAADSAAALAQIRLAERSGWDARALAAASMVDMVASSVSDTGQGLAWLLEHLPRQNSRIDRSVRNQALALTEQPGDHTFLRSLPGSQEVAAAWRARADALAAYLVRPTTQRSLPTVVRWLLDQHRTRAVGADPGHEITTAHLVRSCALRHAVRRTESR